METVLLENLGLGAVVGLVMGVTGAGGGVLAVPLLIFSLHATLRDAAPMALVSVALASGIGTAMGLRAGHVRYRAAALMALLGFVGIPLGLWLGERVPNAPLNVAFAAVLVVSAARILRGRPAPVHRAGESLPCLIDPAEGRLHWTPRCGRMLSAAGLGAGFLSGLLGIGGGFVLVPVLMRATDMDLPNVTATALAVVALISTVSFAMNLAAGTPIAWSLALPFCAGNVLGLLLGRRLMPHLPPHQVRAAFALVCLLAAGLLVVRSFGGAAA